MMTPTALPPQTVDEILTRAARPDFDRWAEQVTHCGHCSHPVRLRGRVEHRITTGARVEYSTDGEPDRVLLIRCGNRRAAVCPSCSYEYAAHIAFNWHAPELWRRFTITLRRTLAHQTGLTAAEFARRCRVSFVKVAEFQRRGVVHFHALIRLDGPGDDYQPPQVSIDATGLAEAIRQAAAQVRLTVAMPDGHDLVLRFGTQLDTQTVNGSPVGELTPEHAARYIAKYATKSAEDFGLGERRITPETLPLLDVNDHVDRLVHTAWQLGEHDTYEGLHRWVHMLGFRGHFASKSRHYSTTLGAIRRERRTYRQRQTTEHAREPHDEDTTLLVSHWEFAGVGYLTTGDTVLARSAAARTRERRQIAKDEKHAA